MPKLLDKTKTLLRKETFVDSGDMDLSPGTAEIPIQLICGCRFVCLFVCLFLLDFILNFLNIRDNGRKLLEFLKMYHWPSSIKFQGLKSCRQKFIILIYCNC